MLLNPTLFSIIQSKELGMWPPSDIVGLGILPYIKRLKESNLQILDVGVMKGENSFYLLEKDTDKKIEKIYGIISYDISKQNEFAEYQGVLENNMKNEPRFTLDYADQEVNVVCINSNSDLDLNLEKYYNAVKSNGIFCGNDHQTPRVKEALLKFRRKNRIGTPIMIANDCWFWIKR